MRLQNAIRRAEASDRSSIVSVAKRAREISSPPTMVTVPQHQQQLSSPQPQIVTVTVQSANATAHQPTTNGNAISGTMSHKHSILKLINFDFVDEKKMLFDCSSELLKKFRYPWEMMPVLWALSKYANGNIEEILQKIDEGIYSCFKILKVKFKNFNFRTICGK